MDGWLFRIMKICLLAVVVWCLGCSTPTNPTYPRTSLGIQVNGDTDFGKVDMLTIEVEKCLNEHGYSAQFNYEDILLTIKLDRVRGTEEEAYKCKESPTGWCAGNMKGNKIFTTPNLMAYKHELIHWHGYLNNTNLALVCA